MLNGSTAAGSLLSARGVTLNYAHPAGDVQVLTGVDLTVQHAELCVIYGSSGSGKTSLLQCLSGILIPPGGQVQLHGVVISSLQARERDRLRLNSMGMVFQHGNLIPEFTVRENIELVLAAQGIPRRTRRDEVDRVVTLMGIADLAPRRPNEISGGQAQRVGIARAIAGNKSIVFADEPTGALDQKNSLRLFDTLREMTEQAGVGVVVCTHDPMARGYATHAYDLVDGHLVRSDEG